MEACSDFRHYHFSPEIHGDFVSMRDGRRSTGLCDPVGVKVDGEGEGGHFPIGSS